MTEYEKQLRWLPLVATAILVVALSAVLFSVYWVQAGRTQQVASNTQRSQCMLAWANATRDALQASRNASTKQRHAMRELVDLYQAGVPPLDSQVQEAGQVYDNEDDALNESIKANPLPMPEDYCEPAPDRAEATIGPKDHR